MASSDNQETAKKPLHVCGVVLRKRSDVGDIHLSDCFSSHASWEKDLASRAARTGNVTGCLRSLQIFSII